MGNFYGFRNNRFNDDKPEKKSTFTQLAVMAMLTCSSQNRFNFHLNKRKLYDKVVTECVKLYLIFPCGLFRATAIAP